MTSPAVAPVPADGGAFCNSPCPPGPKASVPAHLVDPWEAEVTREGFASDLRQNLKDLSKAVFQKKSVDLEFFNILQRDIDLLSKAYDAQHIAHDSHVWSELYRMNVRLQELAATMHEVSKNGLLRTQGSTHSAQHRAPSSVPPRQPAKAPAASPAHPGHPLRGGSLRRGAHPNSPILTAVKHFVSPLNVYFQQLASTARKISQNVLSGTQASTPSKDQVIQPSTFVADNSVVPLVGKMASPMSVASDDDSPVNFGLSALQEKGYRVRRIRGNGHCLFSSIASHLLTQERLADVKHRLPAMKNQRLFGALDADGLIDTCQQKLREGVSVEQILHDDKTYLAWVQFLRTISVNWWRQSITDTPDLRYHLALAARESMTRLPSTLSDQEVCDRYLDSMMAMTEEPRYGGVPEMYALQEILGITINAIDANQVGCAKSQREVDSLLPKVADLSHMWLLYKGSHFGPLYLPEQVSSNIR